jgi:hypothetical protein
MKRLRLENLGWKLLALMIAVTLWIVIVGAPDYFLRTIPSRIQGLLWPQQSRVVVASPPSEAV